MLSMADGGELQRVFELCCPDNEGFILTNSLINNLSELLNDQDLDTIKRVLDPKRSPRISFQQFKGAISELQEGSEELEYENNTTQDIISEHFQPKRSKNSYPNCNSTDDEDSGGFEGTVKTLTSTPCAKEDDALSSDPENTYNEYDVPDADDMAYSVNGDDIMENFEAIGESPYASRPRRQQEQLSLPQESNFRRHGSMRRSHRRNHSLPMRAGSAASSYVAEDGSLHDENSSVTSDLEDLSEKVDILQDHVAKLTEDKLLQAQYEAVNSEKQQLALRNHDLEEKLTDALMKMKDMKEEFENKMEDIRAKLTRENELLIEVEKGKLKNSEQENTRLAKEIHDTKELLSKHKEENLSLTTKVDSLTAQVMQTNEEYRHLNNQTNAQRERLEEERVAMQEDMEMLRIQLEEVHADKSALVERLSSINLNQSPSAALLSAKLTDLEQENERLKSTNEDLNVQLARNIVDARTLIGKTNIMSIGDEMASATRDEVVEALHKQEIVNVQLKEYLDKIILSVLEKDPSILEIK